MWKKTKESWESRLRSLMTRYAFSVALTATLVEAMVVVVRLGVKSVVWWRPVAWRDRNRGGKNGTADVQGRTVATGFRQRPFAWMVCLLLRLVGLDVVVATLDTELISVKLRKI